MDLILNEHCKHELLSSFGCFYLLLRSTGPSYSIHDVSQANLELCLTNGMNVQVNNFILFGSNRHSSLRKVNTNPPKLEVILPEFHLNLKLIHIVQCKHP